LGKDLAGKNGTTDADVASIRTNKHPKLSRKMDKLIENVRRL